MDNKTIIKELCSRYPQLISVASAIEEAAEFVVKCFSSEGKLLVCGNGGSSSDSDHLVGELMKSFELKRAIKNGVAEKLESIAPDRGVFLAQKLEGGLPAISLSSQTALTTAVSNDMDASLIFAQQVIGYGTAKDILVAISTSGNSQNVIDACITAKALNIKVIGLTGITGGRMKQYCDILINVPEKRTAYVQELHLPVIHTLCSIIENHFYTRN
jgi:D-sedoheptulose 7-phosphate isomerase